MTFTGEFLKTKDITESKFLISVNSSFNHLCDKVAAVSK